MSYDPSKVYTWSQDTKFELNGEEFGVILNAVRANLATPEATRILSLDKAAQSIEKIMERSVDQGIVTEMIKEPPTKPAQLNLVK